jgi:hypothetical protein
MILAAEVVELARQEDILSFFPRDTGFDLFTEFLLLAH